VKKNPSRRGAVFSIDALFGALTVVLIVYIGYMVFWTVASRTNEMADSNEKEGKLLLISDYLVKDKLVSSDDSKIYQHQIETEKLKSLDARQLAEQLGLNSVGVSLLLGREKLLEKGSGSDCLRRIVWVPEYERVGYLEVCIE
jgi:hypothetical protein